MPKTPNPSDLFSYADRSNDQDRNSPKKRFCPSSVLVGQTDKALEQPLVTPQSKNVGAKYLRVGQVAQRYGVSIATVWRWADEDNNPFPKPIRLSKGTTRWNLDELETHEAKTEAERDGAND